MPAPWEMNYGPYWESELRRREVGRRALGQPEVSPAVKAGELYGVEEARLGEKRGYMQQAMTNWQNRQTINMAKKQQSQKMAGQAVSGVANLALTGYKVGKEAGLWGGEASKEVPMNTLEWGETAYGPSGGTAGTALPQAVPGAITGSSQAGEAIGAASLIEPAGFGATGPMEVGLTTAGTLAPQAITGGGGITTAIGSELLAPEMAGIAMGAEAVTGAAAAASPVETGLASVLGFTGTLGPVGWVVGGVLSILSLAFGDQLGKIFNF